MVLLRSSTALWFVVMGHRMHLCRRFPINSWRPTRAKTDRAKTVRIMTSTIFFTDWIKAATMVFKPGKTQSIWNRGELILYSSFLLNSPGITVIVLRARSTRNVLRAETLPRSTNSVMYLPRQRRGAQVSNKKKKNATRRREKTDSVAHLRHTDDHEIQPIPWVSEECKRSNAETSRQHFDRCLNRVDASKNISKKKTKKTTRLKSVRHLRWQKKAVVILTRLFYSMAEGCSSSWIHSLTGL